MSDFDRREFISERNKITIWDVISDRDAQLYQTEQEYIQLQRIFIQAMNDFYERDMVYPSLIEMNKRFIGAFLRFARKTDPVKAEERKIERQNQFDTIWKQKQADFVQAHTMPVPKEPIFREKMDTPVERVEDLITKMMEERKYDIEPTIFPKEETYTNTQKNRFKYNVPDIKLIQIGEERNVEIEAVPLVFASESAPTESILSKLKPKASEFTPSLQEQITGIQEDIRYIISLLESKKP